MQYIVKIAVLYTHMAEGTQQNHVKLLHTNVYFLRS